MATKNSFIEPARALVRLLVEETAHLPRWSQPFVIVGIAACFTVAMIFLCPFMWLSRRRARQQDAVRAIRLHVERLWLEESPAAAVSRLRAVLATARSAPELSCVIEPYGELNAFEADFELSYLLYGFEAGIRNWAGAMEVADYFIGKVGEARASSWLLPKARCLLNLDRNAEARELLFRIRALDGLRDEANELLAKLPISAA